MLSPVQQRNVGVSLSATSPATLHYNALQVCSIVFIGMRDLLTDKLND
jgi:hypothetical protein